MSNPKFGDPPSASVRLLYKTNTQTPLMKFWYAYVTVFLIIWAVLMFVVGMLPDVIRQWQVALVMVLGSLVAGSTPMGGGAVSFPFLVLWVGMPPEGSRDFALAIQALGMTSAMIFIFCRRTAIQCPMLLWTIFGAAPGMFLGTIAIAPYVPANFVKLTFACTWMSFAILTIAKNREFCSIRGDAAVGGYEAIITGLSAGLVGGIVASVIGIGVEMCLYTVLVLLYRCDLKVAVPTAVSAMAVTSLVGLCAHLWIGDISRDVATKFLAAGPIVIFGAPIGTYIVSIVPRMRILYVISALCVSQFVWTLWRLQRTSAEWVFVAVSITVAGVAFRWMYGRGRAREYRMDQPKLLVSL